MDTDIERLFNIDLFNRISEEQKPSFRSAVRVIEVKQGEILFEQGSPATHFYFVLEGWVSVLRLHESGARTVLHVFGADESFAEVAAMAIGDYPATAEAATRARLVSIPAKEYQKLIEQDASFAMRVIGSLAQRMRTLIDEFESSQRTPGTLRLAQFLISITEEQDIEDISLELPFSKQLLAARLHMQPETLSRAFSELREYGIESHRDGKVHIENMENLRQLTRQ